MVMCSKKHKKRKDDLDEKDDSDERFKVVYGEVLQD